MDLDQLTKLIALCRKNGVQEIETEGIKLKLSDNPPPQRKRKTPELPEPDAPAPTEEELLFWSAQGVN